MRIGVISKEGTESRVREAIKDLDHEIIFGDNLTIHQDQIINRTDLDLLLIFGGDGTILKVANSITEPVIPIFSVNLGHLGYLTNSSFSDFPKSLTEWIDLGMPTSNRKRLRYRSVIETGICFNEFAFLPVEIGRLVSLDLFINGVFVRTIKGDGIIVATENGSTAYAMSAGGPIIHPDARVMVVVPNNEFAIGSRPIVISEDAEVQIKAQTSLMVFKDGRPIDRLGSGSMAKICKDSVTIPFAKYGETYGKIQ